MKYAEIRPIDVANGPGLRVSLFVSGCRHHCKGCFNHEAWDFNFGREYTQETEDYILNCLNKPHIHGLTFLGGEPLEPENQGMVSHLIHRIREELPQKTLWLYTGFVYEDLLENARKEIVDILQNIDVLVDGKFDADLYDVRLVFRGSSNQRLIDMTKTRKDKEVILWERKR